MAVLTGAVLMLVISASAVSSASTYKPVVIANGWSPSDVGTAAPLAASLGGSVLYANTDSLGDPTVDALEKLKPSEIVLVGGTAVLSADIVTELGEVVPGVPVTRLAGDDRIHTAALAALHTLGTATPAVTDTDAASEASTGPGTAQDYQNGYSEARFRVGTDLLPGVWQFSRDSGSGRVPVSPTSYTTRYGGHCRHNFGEDGSNAAQIYVVVNEVPVRGDLHRQTGTDTYRFGLVDGDIVTLQASAGDVCEIERVSD
ncbi:cell wall-binding repeat-containing protein [Candidatus Poriferisodalis sp.]|uniref:cell wall-binding repeat-containing protein n=1 Tax=Candidatus Poriferisodalis sp. TaxID=3101277 RepID=UPI003B019EB1